MKNYFYFLMFLMVCGPIFGQEKEPVDLKEHFLDAEYFLAQEEYIDALYDYQELYNNGYRENANINYRIGICYLNIVGQKDKSVPYLLEAVKNVAKKYKESSLKQVAAPVDAWLFLGNAYRVNNQLAKAIEAYNKYKELANSQAEISYADQQIAASNAAIRYMDSPLQIRFTDLGDSVNGASSNYKAVVSGNGLVMAYMNELPFYRAVYISRFTPAGWSAPVNITPQIQSDGDQFVTSVSYDGTRLYLTKEDAFNSDIYVSEFQRGKWSRSVPVGGQEVNTKYWESHASVSKDGKTLYFTSNRKDGQGEMDIYRSHLQSSGGWGMPENLGGVINTGLNEDTPFITDNDSVLYFSSQGHETMGGYDIFKSVLQPSGAWSFPENIRYPLNTTDDDLFYYPWKNGRVIYASLIRPEGLGKEDIYAMQPYQDVALAELLNEFIYPEQVQVPVAAPVAQTAPVAEPAVQPAVQPAAEPAVTPAVPPAAEPAAPPTAEPAPVAQTPPVAEPTSTTPAFLQLDPLYFAFDKTQLTEDGKVVLDKIAGMLNNNAGLSLKLLGNADSRGAAEYNLKLSQRRAEEAMQYLIAKGISAKRLSAQGLGEKKFAAINSNPDGTDSPEGRQYNRRVEYEITGPDNKRIGIILPPVPENLRFKE